MVAENVNISQVIGTVHADDVDKTTALYKTVYYKIVKGNVGDAFTLSEMNGTLTVRKKLDRETTPSYSLTLAAFNKDINGNATLSSEVTVTDSTVSVLF